MALLTRKRVILIESESSYGTDPNPTATDVVLVRDLSITPQASDVVNRDVVRPFLGASEQLLANTSVEVSFSVELAGSGTKGTAPRYGAALKACGLSETVSSGTSVTYAPVSSSFSSVTIHYNTDGVRHKVTGARGSFAINASAGEIPSIDFTFTGIYNAPDDSALPSITYGNQETPLVFKNGNTTSFQFLSYSAALMSFSMDIGNTTVYRELVGGTKEVLITDRAANGSVSIEAVLLGTKDYFAAALTDSTLGNLTITHGTAEGNIVTLSSTKVDIGDVAYGEADGIQMLEIPYTLVPSSQGNELSLVFT
tara:strand:+ start:1051 stop:1983 length:933 start_codon:yes stop_codon:yes gene_type:complete